MRMIDDDAAAIWNHQGLKHGVKRFSPRHLRSDMNAMLSQYGTAVAIVVTASEKTARARDMQIDIVVREEMMFRIRGFQEAGRSGRKQQFAFRCR